MPIQAVAIQPQAEPPLSEPDEIRANDLAVYLSGMSDDPHGLADLIDTTTHAQRRAIYEAMAGIVRCPTKLNAGLLALAVLDLARQVGADQARKEAAGRTAGA